MHLLFMINRRLIFLLRQKWKTFLLERLFSINKHDVNGRGQTAKTTSDFQFFSSYP